jgi:hypothetical protein
MMDLQQLVSESEAFLKISRYTDHFCPQISLLGFLFLSIVITFFFVSGFHHLHSKVAHSGWKTEKFCIYTTFNILGFTKLQLFCGHVAASFKNP